MDTDVIADAVEGCSLPKPEWTHQAHLAAGLPGSGATATPTRSRTPGRSIRRYNESTGVANTDTGGYHETITRYYLSVLARHAAVGSRFADVLADPATGHDAMLRHWRRETLFSVAARRDWVPPDLVPLVA